jgi:Fe-S-cluster containining protein
MPDFKKKFYDLTALIQTEFDRNLDMYGEKIQCRKGCSKCCSQIFRITPYDGWMISEYVKSLPESRRNELKQKALEYLETLPLTKGEYPQGEGVLKQNHPGSSGLPCPALGTDGECTIYEVRPVICRRFGMPIYDYKNPSNVHACELNFKDGEELADDLLIPNQTAIGMKWDELKDAFAESLPAPSNGTTIAEAIMNA